MQVNNIPRNDNIQSDTSHTKSNQNPDKSEDSSYNKPVIHAKERKPVFSENATDEVHAKTLSPDVQKQAINRFNNIDRHFELIDEPGEDRLDPYSEPLRSPNKNEVDSGEKTTVATAPSTNDNPVKNEKPSALESAVKMALDSEENKKFQQYLGIRSPEAEKAVTQLKTEKNNSSNHDLDETEENIIKKNQLQETITGDTPRPLGKIQAQELGDAVFGKKCFPQFANTPEGTQFVKELMEVVDQKMSQMKPTDKGMALIFRFPGTYGVVGHVAIGSLWRDSQGKLQLDISHQESIGPQPELKRLAYTGRIFDTFDTHESYPGKIAPVIESMKLFGLPSVNVFPVPQPEILRPYTEAFAKIGYFTPYGATRQWKPAAGSGAESAIRPETCFNVVYKTWNKLNGVHVNWEPTLPNVFLKLKPLLGIPADAFTKFKDKNKKEVTLEEACKDEDNAVGIFVQIGPNWVNSGPADINGKSRLQMSRATIKNGETGVPLKDGISAFKFIDETRVLQGLSLDGTPVIKDKVYTADEARRMHYVGKKDALTISYLAPATASNTERSKL